MKARTISIALAGALLLGCGGDTTSGELAQQGADLGLEGKGDSRVTADTAATTALTLPPRETLARFLARGVEFYPAQSATRAVATFYTKDRVDPTTTMALWGVDVTNRKVVFQIAVPNAELGRGLGLIDAEVLRKQVPVAGGGPGGSILEGIFAGSAGQIKSPPPPPPPIGDEWFAHKLVTAGTRLIGAQQFLMQGPAGVTAGP